MGVTGATFITITHLFQASHLLEEVGSDFLVFLGRQSHNHNQSTDFQKRCFKNDFQEDIDKAKDLKRTFESLGSSKNISQKNHLIKSSWEKQ